MPVIFELLSSKVCSSLLSISVSKVLLLFVNSRASSEICLCVSALNEEILSPFCWNFSGKVSSRVLVSFVSLDGNLFFWATSGFFSVTSLAGVVSLVWVSTESWPDTWKMRSRISLIRSLVSSGVVILRFLFFFNSAKNMPH